MTIPVEILLKVTDQASGAFRKLSNELGKVDVKTNIFTGTARGVNKALLSLKTTIAGLGLGLLAWDITKSGAELERMNATMKVVAKNTGTSDDQLQQFKESLKEVNTHGRHATATITTFLQSGLAGTVDFEKFIGVTKDFAASMGVSSGEAIQDFTKALTTLRPELLETYGIQFNLGTLYKEYSKTLGKTSADLTDVEKRQALLNEVFRQGEKVAGVYKETYSTAGKNLLSIKDTIQNLKDEIGLALQPAFEKFTNMLLKRLQEAVKWFEENRDKVNQWGQELAVSAEKAIDTAIAIGKWALENKDLLLTLGKLVLAFILFSETVLAITKVIAVYKAVMLTVNSIMVATKIVTLALSGAFTTLILPILTVVAVIGVLVGIGYLIYKNWDLIKQKATELWESLVNLGNLIKTSVIDAFNSLKNAVVDSFNTFVEYSRTKLEEWKTAIIEGIKTAIDYVLLILLAPFFLAMNAMFGTSFEEFAMIVQMAWDNIGLIWSQSLESIKQHLETFKIEATTKWQETSNWIQDTWTAMSESLLLNAEYLNNGLNQKTSKIRATVTTSFNLTSAIVKTTWNLLRAEILQRTEGLRSGIEIIFNNLLAFFNYLKGKIVDAIVSPFRTAYEEVKNYAQKIKDAAKMISPFHRESPSLVDNVESGVGKIIEEYRKLRNEMDGMGLGVSGAGNINPVPGSGSTQSNITLTVNVGMYAGNASEKREIAQEILDALTQTAQSRNMSVSEMIGRA